MCSLMSTGDQLQTDSLNPLISIVYIKPQIRRIFRVVMNAMSLRLVGVRWSRHDIRNECLGVAVVEREPRALNLDHETMTREKSVVQMWQRNRVIKRLIGRKRFRIVVVLTVPTPEDFCAYHKLVAGHLECRIIVRENVNELHHPISIGAGGLSEQLSDHRPTNSYRLQKRLANPRRYIRSAIDEALVLNEPTPPGCDGSWIVIIDSPVRSGCVGYRLLRI